MSGLAEVLQPLVRSLSSASLGIDLGCNRFGVWGLGFGTGFGVGNMKQDEYRKHETRGGMGSGTGDEQISRNNKAGGGNGSN